MLADLYEIREADFSHLRLASGSLVDVTPDERLPQASSSRYLIAGLALSILLHGLFLLWQKSPSLIPVSQKASPPLHITLNRTPVIQQNVAEQPAELEPSEKGFSAK